MFLLRFLEFHIILLVLSHLTRANRASVIIKSEARSNELRQAESDAYKYFKQYWQAIPPNAANDPCTDFVKYVCPPVAPKLLREEGSNGWDGAEDFLDDNVPDAAGYGFYEYTAAKKSIFNYWNTKYGADNRPAWQKNIKAFYDKCEEYIAAGGVSSDSKFTAFKDEIKANTDELFTDDYFPRLFLAVQKYNSARNMKPHERDIAYGMYMFIPGPYFAQEVPVFNDVPLRSMFVGGMYSSLPYYNKALPEFMLYANPVMVLAHEMVHALDMPVDSPIHTGFTDFKQCLIKEYSKNNIVDNDQLLKVDGRATLAENFADYIAWRAAKKAYDDIKDASTVPADIEPKDKNKLFFMAAGASLVTCIAGMKFSKTILWANQAKYVHTFGANRGNEAFRLWPEFAQTFGCGPGTPMGHKGDKCEKLFKI